MRAVAISLLLCSFALLSARCRSNVWVRPCGGRFALDCPITNINQRNSPVLVGTDTIVRYKQVSTLQKYPTRACTCTTNSCLLDSSIDEISKSADFPEPCERRRGTAHRSIRDDNVVLPSIYNDLDFTYPHDSHKRYQPHTSQSHHNRRCNNHGPPPVKHGVRVH